MKQGNQFYLELEIGDNDDNLLNIDNVKKVQFNINKLIKIYDGNNEEVIYDDNKKTFKIWLKENETFEFGIVKIDARVLFKDNTILGTGIYTTKFNDVVNKEELDVKDEN